MSEKDHSFDMCEILKNELCSGPVAGLRGWRLVVLAVQMAVVLAVVAMANEGGAATGAGATGIAAGVNPFIGTGRGPGPPDVTDGGDEDLFPGATVPFGMVQLSPDTESNGNGYRYYQDTIQGVSMTHLSGGGCANEGDVFLTPTTGPIHTQVSGFQSPYSHDREAAAPGYYQVHLSRWDVDVELTATERTGIARFSFPAGKSANILVPISHTLNYTVAAHVQVVGDGRIEGYVVNQTFCGGQKPSYKVYFVMTFSRPFTAFGTWNGNEADDAGNFVAGNRQQTQVKHGQWVGAYVSWPAAAHPQTIVANIGISYVDLNGAKNNLRAEAEGKPFSAIRQQADATWNRALNVIDVSGGTSQNRTVFYTALYHSLLMPSIFSDADGRYLGFDNKIHTAAAGHLIYANYSGWDIYRSEMPLLALIEPHRMEDMAQSIVLMYKQGGWIDRWPQFNLYTNDMVGSPLTIVLCMAWLDGLHGFDIRAAWQGMLLDATHAPPPGRPYTGEVGMDWINQLHYLPDDKIDYGSVSWIQEDSIAYASLYRLALKLGKTDEAKNLYQRALYYRNVFDSEDRFFRPRNSDGRWADGFDPAQEVQGSGHGFVEGSGWHYQWLAPADMAWLVHAVGPELFNRRLRDFFNYKEPAWTGQSYNPYNETDLEAPFEFNFSDEPSESQHAVRRIIAENYTNSPNGIPGNDDCGAMSSWAVLSMMGIYSVDPASLAYELVSPVFPRIDIHLQAPYSGKTFAIETSPNPESTPYIQDVKLNGHTHKKNWISFQDMSAGGTLHLTLGDKPNHEWGSAASDAPPSLSDTR